jgi:hypothetical protein
MTLKTLALAREMINRVILEKDTITGNTGNL